MAFFETKERIIRMLQLEKYKRYRVLSSWEIVLTNSWAHHESVWSLNMLIKTLFG